MSHSTFLGVYLDTEKQIEIDIYIKVSAQGTTHNAQATILNPFNIEIPDISN